MNVIKNLSKAIRLLRQISYKKSKVETTKFTDKLMVKQSAELIDVKQLIKQLSLEEINEAAEAYFARLNNWDYHLAKPFASIDETPELLLCFSQILQGLKIVPGITILDFGSGSCWTSRYLTQLGCHVIALDVSNSALKIGQELYNRQPVIGVQPKPEFILFDGRQIPLANESVDRILCFDAFHHVPNPDHIIKEFSRILKQGGIVGFSEPGENHSKMSQSQHEMRNFKVIENDINIKEIWNVAQGNGFTDIQLSIFNALPFQVSLQEFEDFFVKDDIKERYINQGIDYLENRRLFFLYKRNDTVIDSRQRSGLAAQLNVSVYETIIKEGLSLKADVTVINTGIAAWLPATAKVGAVNLGIHLLDQQGKQINYDYFRHAFTLDEERAIFPDETLSFEIQVPLPPKGSYILEFDLVSEGICWFSINGGKTVRVKIEVV